MRVWRLCAARYADLSGKGGIVVSGRWHNAGAPIVYTASNAALAALEKRVHTSQNPDDLVLLGIDVPDELVVPVEPLYGLPAKWQDDMEATKAIGDRWLAEKRSPGLSVPSVLVPEGRNILVNPRHRDAVKVRIEVVGQFRFDERLFGKAI
jgi:RES domain-containing protein